MRTKEEIVNCMKTLDIENSDIDVEVYKYLEWVLADDVGGNKMGKECIHLVVCRFINEKCIDGICNCWPTQYKADGVNVVLADVLAEFEPMIFDFVESHNEENVRFYLKNKLGKYFR